MAARLKIDHPWTVYPDGAEDLIRLVDHFPVILKPAIKESKNAFTSARAWRVETQQELRARYDHACCLIEPRHIMVQQLLKGSCEARFSYAAVCIDGTAIASVVLQRVRQYPTEFAHYSTYVETVHCPEVEQRGEHIVSAMKYSGVVEIEFQRDPVDTKLKILDANPRFWGSHTIGAAAGVDFPYLQWLLSDGNTLPRMKGRAGVRWVRMLGDVRAALALIKAGALSPWAYLRSLRFPLAHALFALDDPVPVLVECAMMVYRRRPNRSARGVQASASRPPS